MPAGLGIVMGNFIGGYKNGGGMKDGRRSEHEDNEQERAMRENRK